MAQLFFLLFLHHWPNATSHLTLTNRTAGRAGMGEWGRGKGEGVQRGLKPERCRTNCSAQYDVL
jgi:hypothetical protein